MVTVKIKIKIKIKLPVSATTIKRGDTKHASRVGSFCGAFCSPYRSSSSCLSLSVVLGGRIFVDFGWNACRAHSCGSRRRCRCRCSAGTLAGLAYAKSWSWSRAVTSASTKHKHKLFLCPGRQRCFGSAFSTPNTKGLCHLPHAGPSASFVVRRLLTPVHFSLLSLPTPSFIFAPSFIHLANRRCHIHHSRTRPSPCNHSPSPGISLWP